MISIVCAYNNPSILDNWLLKSLKSQTTEHEIITVDTAAHGFRSAAQALNFGGKQARGKYIMFVHQDVDLVSHTWLENAEAFLDAIPNLGIAGVIGSVERGGSVSERMRNVIVHGDDMVQIGNPIRSPEQVQTLDELLLIVPREVFQQFRFDENTCGNWHLYGADYCLTMLTAGRGVYVIPLHVIHKSKGASMTSRLSYIANFGLGREYYQTLEKVLEKHKKNFLLIHITPGYGKWKTTESLFIQRLKHPVIEVLKWFIMKIKSFSGRDSAGRKIDGETR